MPTKEMTNLLFILSPMKGYEFAPQRQARGDSGTSPYYETFGYDAFSNLNGRESQTWHGFTDDFDSASYANNRRSGWGYDADGRNTTIDTRTYTFDAVGRQRTMTAQQVFWNGNHITVNQSSGYDGDGRRVYDVSSGVTTYYLATSVLRGAIIEEINSSGQKSVGYVYTPGGGLLAQQSLGYPSYQVTWKHSVPAGTGQYQTYSNNSGFGRTEFDPVGANVQLYQPPDPPPAEGDGDIGAGHLGGILSARWSDFFNTSSGCSAAGVLASCSGSIAQTNMDAEARAFFGARWYDLPGNANEREQGEERYNSIIWSGYDPAFSRYWGTFTLTFSNGAVRTLKNPTLDELARAQTEYLPDSGSSDQDEHDVTTAYNVNIYGGAAYFATPQKRSDTSGDKDIKTPEVKEQPDPNRGKFDKCFEGWRFSTAVSEPFKGTSFHGPVKTAAGFLEFSSQASLTGDGVATGLKASRAGIGGTTNRYASGLNLVFRRTAPSFMKGPLLKFGTRVTPILSGAGAFTSGYNLTVGVGCAFGVMR